MIVRPERAADHHAIDAVNDAAFGRSDEAALVRRLRADRLVVASIVAEDAGHVVGHLLLSRLPTTVDGRSVPAAALAPMAVAPERQRQGIGGRMIESGIGAARARGVAAIIVLGHPTYYPRFGFSADAARRLAGPFAGEAFMALELMPGALAGRAGAVAYPRAFGLFTA